MEGGESNVKQVLSTLWSYLYSSLPTDDDFIIQLQIYGILARTDAEKLRASAQMGGRACIHDLVTFMYDFFDEPALETFCTFLAKYGQPARPLMLEVAAKIREEIRLKHQQVHVQKPKDPQKDSETSRTDVAPVPGTSVPATFTPGAPSPEPPAPYTPVPTTLSPSTSVPGPTALGAPMSPLSSYTSSDGTSSASMSQPVYLPVIDELKTSFSNLATNVLSIIDSLSSKNFKTFCTMFLSNYLKPSFPPDAPLPVIPESVQGLKPFLIRRWDPLQIALLKAVVKHLESRKIQAASFKANIQQVKTELNDYEDLLKDKLREFLSKCKTETVSLKSLLGHSSVAVKISSSPAEISLARIIDLKGFFISKLGLPDTLFTGFSEGCTVLFFSIPTECVWSLPSSLLPSNLSLLKEWKVLFFSVKAPFNFTVDVKERRVVDSLGMHSLFSSLSKTLNDDLQTRNDDLQTRVQQMEKDLYFKEDELRAMEREVKVLRKGKGKAVTTDQEIEEKVSLEVKPVVKIELSPCSGIKTEPSPVVDLLPLSKRFKTESADYLAYEPPLEKKSEEELLPFEKNRSKLRHLNWRETTSLPDRMTWPSAVCVKGKIYVCSHWSFTVSLNVFDVVTREWEILPFYKNSVVESIFLVTTSNHVHCLGGHWRMDAEIRQYSKLVFTLNCDSLQWSDNTLPPLIIGRLGATSTSFEGMIVVAGGVGEDGQRLSSVEVLNSSQQSSTWWKICDLPVGSPYMQCTVSDTDLFVGCGHGTTRTVYSCKLSAVKEAMAPGDSTSPESFWHALPETPLMESGLAVVNNCLFAVAGGLDDRDVTSSAIHLYDSYNKTWTKVSGLKQNRLSPAVVFCSFENRHELFVFGGWEAETSVESCEVL